MSSPSNPRSHLFGATPVLLCFSPDASPSIGATAAGTMPPAFPNFDSPPSSCRSLSFNLVASPAQAPRTPLFMNDTVYENHIPQIEQTAVGDGVARISISELEEVVQGSAPYVIVDCRYDYENAGGHIRHAIHAPKKQQLEKLFEQLNHQTPKPVVVFHCEYSQHRAPRACRYWRTLDRKSNIYPSLSFPQVYVLEGGYRSFVSQFPENCSPVSGFRSMWDPEFKEQCKEQSRLMKQSWKKRHNTRNV